MKMDTYEYPKKVLIMSASAGNGHIKAAEALENKLYSDDRIAEVINKDALQYTNRLFRDFYSKFYTALVRSAPNFLGWWYKASDEPWRTDTMRQMLDRLNTKPLVKFIQSYDPHIMVCTHFMPAGIISHLIATGQIKANLSIVVTDYDFHAMWLSRAFQRYFVAIDETKAHLEMLGLPSDRITVSGIPIDPAFCMPVDRIDECLRFNLDPTLPTLLFNAVAMGHGQVVCIIERLLLLKSRMQTIVLCGYYRVLRQRVNQLVDGKEQTVRVLGYSDEMYKLMKMSDLYIGKPGGLSSSEAIACGLPICIVSPIPGQEERNSDHLLEQGIAVKCNDLNTLHYKVELLLNEPFRLERMKSNALAFAKIDAASTIVETLIQDDLPPVSISRRKRAPLVNTGTFNSATGIRSAIYRKKMKYFP